MPMAWNVGCTAEGLEPVPHLSCSNVGSRGVLRRPECADETRWYRLERAEQRV